MVLAGLGNPTDKHTFSRHNAGFLFLDWLSGKDEWSDMKNLFLKHKKLSLLSHKDRMLIDLIKPQTFMNDSGKAVAAFCNFYKINPKVDLILIFDDLDLEIGNWKVQVEKGPKIHNGVNSVEELLGTKKFKRIRIGVFNAVTRVNENGEKLSGADYILQDFTKEELNLLHTKIFPQIKESLALIAIE